jgi:drug/metabolite transporter (DMT)-like permease
MKKNHLTLKIFSLIILNDAVDAIAQLVMKKGLITAGLDSVNFSDMAGFILKGCSSGLLWLGILLYAMNFFIWIIILYKIDLSIAMPVGSTSYIFVPIVAIIFLHEKVSLLRWVGILFIVLGIHFVAQSKKKAPEGITNG